MSQARPLHGLRVLLTRPVEQSAAWAVALAAAGAIVIEYPTIEIVPPPSWEPLDEALSHFADYDWLVFTSAAAARLTIARLPPSLDRSTLVRPRVAAVGPETARTLEALDLRVARVPDDARQEGLIAALGDLRHGTRVLFPQTVGGRDDLRNALLARGCIVDVIPASQTVPRRDLSPPPPFDVATFASPSAFRAFVAANGLDRFSHTTVAVIGLTTAAAAEAIGVHSIVADAPSIDALIRAIAQHRPPQGAP